MEKSPSPWACFVYLSQAVLVSFAISGLHVDAAVPESLNYQGYLTNADGTAVNGDVEITFSAFNVDFSGAPLWSQTSTLPVTQGLFTAALASDANPFPDDLFDGPVYIGVFIGGEELLPRRALTSSAYAFRAADADALQGVTAADLDQSADITRLEGDIAATGGSIQDLTTAVGQNGDRISDLELVGGDITSVLPGAGLTGGSTSGDAVLQVAAGGIVSSMIGTAAVTGGKLADGSVDSSAIQDLTIQRDDIGFNAVGAKQLSSIDSYVVGGLTIDGGAFRIQSDENVIITDPDSQFLWFSGPGILSGTLAVSSDVIRLRHNGQSSDVLLHDSAGLRLAGASSASGFAVTAPSLKVHGALEADGEANLDLGIETVVQSFGLTTQVFCTLNGNNACFAGAVTATCPVGKRVIGGGWGIGLSSGNSGYVTASGPTGADDGWSCEGVVTQAAFRTCRAICINDPS